MKSLNLAGLCLAVVALLAADANAQQNMPSRAERNRLLKFPTNDRLTFKTFNGRPVNMPELPVVTLSEALRFSGFGGCNSVSADFRIQPTTIRFGPLNFTTNKCGNDADKLEFEIFRAIQHAETWKPVGNRTIEISGRGGTVVLGPAF